MDRAGDVARPGLEQLQILGDRTAPGRVEAQQEDSFVGSGAALGQILCKLDRAVQFATGEQQGEHLPAQLEIVGRGGQGTLELLGRAAQVAGIQRRAAGQVVLPWRLAIGPAGGRVSRVAETDVPPASVGAGRAGGQRQRDHGRARQRAQR